MVKDKDWNKAQIIFQDEYSSIVEALNENVLRPLVQKGQSLDKDALDAALMDLNNKLRSEEINVVPQKIKTAYTSLRNLAISLRDSKDEEVTQNLDVMERLFNLFIDCCSYRDGYMDGLYLGRNPCREDQYGLYSSLAKAKRRLYGDSKLLDAVDGMLKVCSNCPYKTSL